MAGMVREEGKTVCPLCRGIARTMTTSKVEFFVTEVCSIYGKARFPHSFWQFGQNYSKTMPFYKISTPGN